MRPPLVTAWSYSRFGLYKQCPLKFKLKHIDKLPDPSGPAAERGNIIHSMAENHIKAPKKVKVPAELKNVAEAVEFLRVNGAIAEQEWAFRKDWQWTGRPRWFGDDVWVRMKADAIITYDDNTGMGVDWKTGRRYEEHADQAELTGLLMLMRYPEMAEADVRFFYVDEKPGDNVLEECFTRAEVPALQKKWEKAVQPMFNDRKFAPKPNRFCNWCAFSKAKGGPCKF